MHLEQIGHNRLHSPSTSLIAATDGDGCDRYHGNRVPRPAIRGSLPRQLRPQAGSTDLGLAVPPARRNVTRQNKNAWRVAANREPARLKNCRKLDSSPRTRNRSYVVIPSASRVRSRSALSAALVPLGGAAAQSGLAGGLSVLLSRSSLMLTSSRSRHSAHFSQASESACQPDCPSRSDASRDASLHACARFRQSDTLIIVVTPPNAPSQKSYGQQLGVQ